LVVLRRFQHVDLLKISSIGTSFGEVTELTQGEYPMLLVGISNLLDYEICPHITQYLREHDRYHILNFFLRHLGYRHQPFRFPSMRDLTLKLHGGQAVIIFLKHIRGAVLDVKTGGAVT